MEIDSDSDVDSDVNAADVDPLGGVWRKFYIASENDVQVYGSKTENGNSKTV